MGLLGIVGSVVVDNRVGDQPGAFVPNLLLRLGFHAELARIDVGDGTPHTVVGLATIEGLLHALSKLRIVDEVTQWTRLTPEALQLWRDRLISVPPHQRGEIIN